MRSFDMDALTGTSSAPGSRSYRSRAVSALVALTLGVTALVVPAEDASAHSKGFSFRCFFTHRAPDDPIVHPGTPGAAHSHDFYGNGATDAFSTPDTLRGAPTNCTIPENSSGYWAPTLLDSGSPVDAAFVNVYYRPGKKKASTIAPFPEGLRMIAGEAHATAPQVNHVRWGCGTNGRATLSRRVSRCRSGHDLILWIRFPDCWNGTTLDSSDHKSHMAYSSRGRCPLSHPQPVPVLVVSIHYPPGTGPSVALSSGGQHSGHADYMEGWNRTAFESLVERCINRGEHCHFGAP